MFFVFQFDNGVTFNLSPVAHVYKPRRQNSHSPEQTFKEKGAGNGCVWQSHIFYTNIFKVKKIYSTSQIESLTPYKRVHQVGLISLSYNWVILNNENNHV